MAALPQNSPPIISSRARAPGNLAHYLVDKTVVHAWPMPAGRFDIGSLDTYEEAKRKYR